MKGGDNGSVDYTTFTLHSLKPEVKIKKTPDEVINGLIEELRRLYDAESA